MPVIIDCFLFCMFVLVEREACHWIHVAFLAPAVCKYMLLDIIINFMIIIIIMSLIFYGCMFSVGIR